MARTTARYCLWTILFFSQMTILRANANEIRTHRFPIEIDHLLVIPATHQPQFKTSQFRDLLEVQCDFLLRTMLTNRPSDELQDGLQISPRREVVDNDFPPRPAKVDAGQVPSEFNSTCPMEFSDVADCQPIVSAPTYVSERTFGQFWIETWQVVASQRGYLILSQRWLKQEIEAFEGKFRESVSSAANSLVTQVNAAFQMPASKPSPMTPVSHAKIIDRDVETESTIEVEDKVDSDSCDEESIEEMMTQPINIDDSMDPYWQYYEDCDRWGVNFAMLLSDPSIVNGDFDVKMPDPNQCNEIAAGKPVQTAAESSTTHPSKFQQWLGAFPTIGRDTLQTVQNWMEDYEFQSVEMESVDLDSIQKPELPTINKAWWEDLKIELNYQIEILTCNFSEIIASVRQVAQGSQDSIASHRTDTRK